ncbi:hypothetical protein ACJMK2_044353 [Sinanodonta woodiana]|uniref:Uncharacterized protein n=1 Tax=Sinanodonta woodiana TaxID=1069815 RepID=A0ABD3VZS0_SINWO
MSDTSTDSDDTSLTDWSLVDKNGHLDESDSLSTASSVEVLEDDAEELEDEDETAAHIQRRSPIGAGPVFVLRLSSRESVKRDHKTEGDATPMTSSITMSASASASILSPDSRELQENQIAMNNGMANSTAGSSSLELVKGDNSFHSDVPYQVEEILTCTDDTSEGKDGRETVDPIETVTIESVGSQDERPRNLQDLLAFIAKIVPKTGDEVKMESQSEIKTESDIESAAVMETDPRTKAETLTEDITEAHREIRTECVNKTEIGLQTETTTEAKNNTLLSGLNMPSEFTNKWSLRKDRFIDSLAKVMIDHLTYLTLFFMILLLGINIGFFLAYQHVKVNEEQQIGLPLMHNDLPRCQEMAKETEKDKLIDITPKDTELHSDSKAIPKSELQKEEKQDSVSQSDHLLADQPCPILVNNKHYSLEEQDHAERGVCHRKIESQSSHMETENAKSKPLVQNLAQTDGMKNPEAFIDTDFPKSPIAVINEKNETKNAQSSDENVNVIVQKMGDNDNNGMDTEVDEDEIEDSTDLSEEDNNEDNFNFDDNDYDDDETYADEDDSMVDYDSIDNYKPDSSKTYPDPKSDNVEGKQTRRKLDNEHKSGFDSSYSYIPEPKHAKPNLETGGKQEKESLKYDKGDNSGGPSGARENKWMDTMLDMWNKTRASVTNVTKQIQETWQQVKNLSVDLWEKNQPYVEKLQQQLGSTMEEASHSLQKKFEKATRKIQKVTRRWFRGKDSDVDVAEDDSYEEDAINLDHAKTSRRPFNEEVKNDGGPKATKQEKKRDQAYQPPLANAHAKTPRPDKNHFNRMEKGSPEHKHNTKLNKDHGSYGDCQRRRKHDTTQEHCGRHSKHAENKFKRACKKNFLVLFRYVNKVNRNDLSRYINLNKGDQIFYSFSKFKDQFGLDILTDEIQNWFTCQSEFWEIWGEWYFGGHYHGSRQGIRDMKCIQYLKCWQIEEMDPAYFTAQKCRKRDYRDKMKKLLNDPCADYQPIEYGRTGNPKWDSKPIDKPQMPHSEKDGDYSENKREKKQTGLNRVRNMQRNKVNKDPSDSMDDDKKNVEGDWYLQLASEREYSRTKENDWYLQRLERTHENLDDENKVKQESAWLFERAAKRKVLRGDNEYIKNLDE